MGGVLSWMARSAPSWYEWGCDGVRASPDDRSGFLHRLLELAGAAEEEYRPLTLEPQLVGIELPERAILIHLASNNPVPIHQRRHHCEDPTVIPVLGLDHLLRGFLHILRQRSTDVVALLELTLVIAAHEAFVRSGVDEFALGCFLCHCRLPTIGLRSHNDNYTQSSRQAHAIRGVPEDT